MQFKLTIVLLAFCTFSRGSHLPTTDLHHLSKFLLQSRAAFENNPSDSILCFGEYLDKISEITNVYEEEFGKCFTASEDAMNAIDETFADNRCDLTKLSASTCRLFTDCNAKKSALDFFTCYTLTGNDASRAFFSIGTRAEQYANDVNQKQAQVIYDKDQCNGVCKAKYEESADASWTTLQNCINA